VSPALLQEIIRYVDNEVGASVAADDVDLGIATEGNAAAVGVQLIRSEPVDRRVARPGRIYREETEEARETVFATVRL
jgi:hypothetical protein